jgi:hypothetical protein
LITNGVTAIAAQFGEVRLSLDSTWQPVAVQLNINALGFTHCSFKSGGEAHVISIVCWQVFVLPQASIANQVRVTSQAVWLITLVTVVSACTVTEPLLSLATGGVKDHAFVDATVVLVGQTIVGGVVSLTVIVWMQLVLLPHWSVAVQVRAITRVFPQFVVTRSLYRSVTALQPS